MLSISFNTGSSTKMPSVSEWGATAMLLSCAGRRSFLFLPHLRFNPRVGFGQALLERNRGLPAKRFLEQRVIGISSAHAHRPIDVLLSDLDSRDFRHNIGQLIDGH